MVVVVAGPMGISGAGAPGCGHPSGWPAAARPRGMGLVRAGSGINQMRRPPRGAGPDTEAITRCPRPGLLTWPRALRRGRPGI